MEQIFAIIIAAAFGAIFGSYATLFAYRVPLGESCFGRYFGQKSRCPKCNNIIKTRDLIPLINWIFTLGRCRFCKSKIPRTHLFVELATTTLFILCYLQFGFGEEFIIYSLISVACVILLTTDFTHNIFPNAILNFILIFALANRVLQDQNIIDAIFSGAVGVVVAVIFYQIFFKKAKGLFANQEQSLNYTKFILIAAISLKFNLFLLYFMAVMAIFTMFLLFNIPNKKQYGNFGYVLIIPYLWLMIG